MTDSRARVAGDLRAILDMAGRLEDRAIDRANDRETCRQAREVAISGALGLGMGASSIEVVTRPREANL